MGNPIVINANDYAPGKVIAHAVNRVLLQTYTHQNHGDVINYHNLTVHATGGSPLGQPNILASTGFNDQYMEYLSDPEGEPLNTKGHFSGLKIASLDTPIEYFYFQGFNGPPDVFDMILFDQNDNYMEVITNIAGTPSYQDHQFCSMAGKPPCFSYNFGAYFSGQGVYRIAVGVQAAAGYINLLTLMLE